jgi:hypothetical protein
MSRISLLGALIAAMLVSTSALACKGKTVLLEDDFMVADPGWSNSIVIGGGTAKLTAERDEFVVELHSANDYGDADICVDVMLPQEGGDDAWGGIAFWAEHEDNFYWYTMNAIGAVEVRRFRNNKWLTPMKERRVPRVDARPGTTHTLRVTVQGSKATLYVDNIKVTDLNGQPPKEETFIGLAAESTHDRKITWVFSKLKVTSNP